MEGGERAQPSPLSLLFWDWVTSWLIGSSRRGAPGATIYKSAVNKVSCKTVRQGKVSHCKFGKLWHGGGLVLQFHLQSFTLGLPVAHFLQVEQKKKNQWLLKERGQIAVVHFFATDLWYIVLAWSWVSDLGAIHKGRPLQIGNFLPPPPLLRAMTSLLLHKWHYFFHSGVTTPDLGRPLWMPPYWVPCNAIHTLCRFYWRGSSQKWLRVSQSTVANSPVYINWPNLFSNQWVQNNILQLFLWSNHSFFLNF